MTSCLNEFSTTIKVNGSILIVEDSALFNNTLRKNLAALGYEAKGVYSLEEALLAIEEASFDLVILDLHLPDGEGEDLLQNLNAKQKLKIIVYTSDLDRERRNEWFRYGVLGYLSKNDPFNFVIQQIDKTIKAIQENINYNILIVDDSVVVRRQATSLLYARNYQITMAANGAEAIKAIDTQEFDLVLLDLELPDMNGEDVLKYLKKNSLSMDIPVLIMTGRYDANTIGKLIKQGANEFFTKPFIPEELLLKIDFWIDSRRKSKQLLCEQKLLKEYKSAIDRSAIVSKTDKKGIITFVNDKFCAISGYTKEELIGKPHNLIRHPDMQKEAFEELWRTIKSGQAWEGLVKNLRKDGSTYWVHAVVSPIVDLNGDIVEYMSIRTDITSTQEEKEYIKNELGIKTADFDEARHLTKEYEIAMDATLAVVRTDTNNIITYANNTICKLSGYTKAELIGMNCKKLRHQHHIDNKDCDNLKHALVQKKTVKMRFHNLSKNKEVYYVDTTVIPITDIHGNIHEYLHLMCNVTELVELHNEMEDTQREIIYKMSEVGESRSQETGNHVKRVAEYSKLLALKAGLSLEEAEMVLIASPMHDIGKVGIPDGILKKPGKLDAYEWEIMRSHSAMGYEVLKSSQRPILKAAATIAYQHHEKYNGSGYPVGISGEDIHIYARIVAIADVFDALGSNRVYKKAWELEKIIEMFKEEKGKHFDPNLIELFLNHIEDFLAIRDKFKD